MSKIGELDLINKKHCMEYVDVGTVAQKIAPNPPSISHLTLYLDTGNNERDISNKNPGGVKLTDETKSRFRLDYKKAIQDGSVKAERKQVGSITSKENEGSELVRIALEK